MDSLTSNRLPGRGHDLLLPDMALYLVEETFFDPLNGSAIPAASIPGVLAGGHQVEADPTHTRRKKTPTEKNSRLRVFRHMRCGCRRAAGPEKRNTPGFVQASPGLNPNLISSVGRRAQSRRLQRTPGPHIRALHGRAAGQLSVWLELGHVRRVWRGMRFAVSGRAAQVPLPVCPHWAIAQGLEYF